MAMNQRPRAEHLEWAKVRAREYLDDDEPTQAMGSFISDLSKHDELATDEQLRGFRKLNVEGFVDLASEVGAMRRWIEDFK